MIGTLGGMSQYRLASVQFAPNKAKVPENLARIGELAVQASESGADVVLFSESAACGYFLEGGVLECALSVDQLAAGLNPHLQGLTRPTDLIVGFYERHNETLHNSAAYLAWDNGTLKPVQVYRKFFLPTYGVFDENRFVAPGNEVAVFETRFGTASILICEDVWHSILPMLAALRGAEILYVPIASPARGFQQHEPANVERYARLLRAIAEEHGVYVASSMLLGFEGGKGFAGGGCIFDPEGVELATSPTQEEHILLADVDRNRVTQARAHLPLLSDLRDRWATLLKLGEEVL